MYSRRYTDITTVVPADTSSIVYMNIDTRNVVLGIAIHRKQYYQNKYKHQCAHICICKYVYIYIYRVVYIRVQYKDYMNN